MLFQAATILPFVVLFKGMRRKLFVGASFGMDREILKYWVGRVGPSQKAGFIHCMHSHTVQHAVCMQYMVAMVVMQHAI